MSYRACIRYDPCQRCNPHSLHPSPSLFNYTLESAEVKSNWRNSSAGPVVALARRRNKKGPAQPAPPAQSNRPETSVDTARHPRKAPRPAQAAEPLPSTEPAQGHPVEPSRSTRHLKTSISATYVTSVRPDTARGPGASGKLGTGQPSPLHPLQSV